MTMYSSLSIALAVNMHILSSRGSCLLMRIIDDQMLSVNGWLGLGYQPSDPSVVCYVCRRSLHEASHGHTGGAGLVHGAVGDHSDSPLRVRHGFQQGEPDTCRFFPSFLCVCSSSGLI